jgi:hypothetical protein
MKQCSEGDAVNDATTCARNCNNDGGAPSQVHQQILASSAGGRGSAAIQGGYAMERLRPGLRVKFVSNWTLKMKSVNHRRFSLRRSCYGFGRMAEKGPLLLATMGNAPQCIETSSAVAGALQTLMFCQCLYMMFACLHVLCNLGDVLVLFRTGRPYC